MSAEQVFNPRLVLGLVAAGIVTFAALLLLIAFGGNVSRPRAGNAHPHSVAATGFRGLVTLVGEVREAHLDESTDEWSDHLLIVTLDLDNDPAEVRRLLERRAGEPTLLILPKWLTVRHPVRRNWVRAIGPGAGSSAAYLLGEDAQVSLLRGDAPRRVSGSGLLAGIRLPVPRSPQRISGPNLEPLVTLAGGALVARVGDEPHYVVADPDLLNNHGLRDPATARAALAMIDRMNEGAAFVDFDLTLNGQGAATTARSPNLLQLAFQPPFLVMTLALFAAALLAGLHGAVRFGPARREARAIAFGKAALVENSAGLIRQAEREAHLGPAYADVVRQEAARATAAPSWLQGGDLDIYLNRLGRPDRPSFSELAADLVQARDRHSLMAAARALFQWKKDIIR